MQLSLKEQNATRLLTALANDPLAAALDAIVSVFRDQRPLPFEESYTPNGEPEHERLVNYARCIGMGILALIREAVRQEVHRGFQGAANAVRGRKDES